MDAETRNECEHLCALTEMEQDPDRFLEIKRSVVRILDEEPVRPGQQRPAGKIWVSGRPVKRGVRTSALFSKGSPSNS
jgi:hypothetical protein